MKPEELKQIRKMLGYTQGQMAEKVGVSMQALQLWEYGKRKISSANEKLILDILDQEKNQQAGLVEKFGSLDSLVKELIESRTSPIEERLKQLNDSLETLFNKFLQEKVQEVVQLQVEAQTKEEFKEVHESIYDLFKRNLTYDKEIEMLKSYHQESPGENSAG